MRNISKFYRLYLMTIIIFNISLVKAINVNAANNISTNSVIPQLYLMFNNNKPIIYCIGIIIVFLIILLIHLIRNINKRKIIEKNLKTSNEELTSLYEELEASDEELRSQLEEIEEHEKKLADSEERYRLVFNASSQGLWDINMETNEMYLTKEWHIEFFEDPTAIKNITLEKWYSIIHPEDIGKVLLLRDSLKNGDIDRFSCEYRVLTPQKKYVWIYENTIALRDDYGKIKRIAGSHSNIHYKKLHEEKIEYMAYHDTLTALPNRQALNEKLTKILEESMPDINNGALMFLDIDNFKFINDTYGHGTGDEVLKEIGVRLKEIESDNIFVGRLGGDEFIIIINNIYDVDRIKNIACNIQEVFKKKFEIFDREIFLSTSMGIVLYPDNGTKIDDLLKNADSAMYKSKIHGKDRYMFFSKEMNEEIGDKIFIQNNIRDAIANEKFSLYYQPELDVKTGKIAGFEALIRWVDESYGYIHPEKFIKIAEEMGLIISIGNWVLEKACIFSKKINKNSKNKYVVSVNVSTVQLMQDDFIQTVLNIINKVDIDPSLLGVEITETAMMESFKNNAYKINQLKSLGIKTSLDDFGTGYSSLNYLRQLPINSLKIDKSFIDDLASDVYGTNLTEAIIMIAHKIGLSVVAEGVETKEQLEKLKKCNCDIIQGYYISKALPEERTIEFLQESN